MPAVADEIARTLRYQDAPPPNEACTCDWVVLPLLWASGYERHDIWSRISDNAGQFPDYTMMPNTQDTWFVEAKAWTTELQGDHAVQALNYANSKGRWWVVLTNGRVWRLYDNRIGGLPEARLVTEVRLGDPDFPQFLTAIGKSSVASSELERYALSRRIAAVAQTELTNADSKLIRALRMVLRSEFGLPGVQGSDLADYFRGALSRSSTPIVRRNGPLSVSPEHPAASGDALDLNTLAERTDDLATGRKPSLLSLPDGSCREVRHWRAVAFQTITWLFEQEHVPVLPFRGQEGGNRYFINAEPRHGNGEEMRSAQVLTIGDRTVHVDTWRSAREIIRCLVGLCAEVGVPASSVSVRMGSQEQ